MIILGNVLQRIFNRVMNLLFILIIPTLICFFILYTAAFDSNYSIGIADYDNTSFTKDFISYMKNDCEVKPVLNNDDIKSLIVNDGLKCVFVFEKNFTEALLKGENVQIKSYFQEGSNYSSPVQTKANSYISAAKIISAGANGDESTFYEGMKRLADSGVKVKYLFAGQTSTEDADSTMKAFGYIAFCMIMLMASSTSLILDDKLLGVTKRLSITPLSRLSYYAQHMCAYLIIYIIQLTIVIFALPLFTDVVFASSMKDILNVFAICIVFSAACITTGIAINRCAKNKLVVTSINALIILPMLMLGGCFWPRDIMPDILQNIGNVMPTTWFLKAADVIVYGGGLYEAMKYIIILIAFSALMLVVSFAPKISRE